MRNRPIMSSPPGRRLSNESKAMMVKEADCRTRVFESVSSTPAAQQAGPSWAVSISLLDWESDPNHEPNAYWMSVNVAAKLYYGCVGHRTSPAVDIVIPSPADVDADGLPQQVQLVNLDRNHSDRNVAIIQIET